MKTILTLIFCLTTTFAFGASVKILDVIELPNENRIQVIFVGLDDNDKVVTHQMNKKFTPNAYKKVKDIENDLIEATKSQLAPVQAIEDLKVLKGKKIPIPQ